MRVQFSFYKDLNEPSQLWVSCFLSLPDGREISGRSEEPVGLISLCTADPKAFLEATQKAISKAMEEAFQDAVKNLTEHINNTINSLTDLQRLALALECNS